MRPVFQLRSLVRPAVLAAAGALLLGLAATGAAQDSMQVELRDSRLRLQEIRNERERLRREMRDIEGRVRDVSSELANIERQVQVSASAIRELEFQSVTLSANVDRITRELVRTRDRLRERSVLLNGRLRSIYKRGPLHAVQVLLTAESFSDLMNRYKYLHLVAVYDRMLLEEIRSLEHALTLQDAELKASLGQLERLRAERMSEFAQLQVMESQHEEALRGYRSRARRAEGQLEQLARDEARVAGLIANLEERRREAERRRVVSGGTPNRAGSLSTEDLGNLSWPVDGRLVYRFGRDRQPNGVILRRNGIGIAAPVGTPVRAVEAGTVVLATHMEGYGPGVVISHGDGYYSLYLYLRELRVQEGQDVTAGTTLGTVGGESTAEGAHLFFRVHAPVRGSAQPVPVDPLNWLRARPATR